MLCGPKWQRARLTHGFQVQVSLLTEQLDGLRAKNAGAGDPLDDASNAICAAIELSDQAEALYVDQLWRPSQLC